MPTRSRSRSRRSMSFQQRCRFYRWPSGSVQRFVEITEQGIFLTTFWHSGNSAHILRSSARVSPLLFARKKSLCLLQGKQSNARKAQSPSGVRRLRAALSTHSTKSYIDWNCPSLFRAPIIAFTTLAPIP